MNRLIRKKEWLLPVILILFLLEAVLFPFATGLTYAGRNESPHHILTYSTGKLLWDSATDVDEETGVAELSLFNSVYQNVQADNGDKVIAPGTQGKNIIRLKNNVDYSIQYVAVMYRMKEEDALPVEPVMADDAAFTDTETYPLPEGVTKDQVVRAVTGTVGGNKIQDFDISWLWEYYESDERDQIDTSLGNKAAWDVADEVMAGLYIVVTDDYDPDYPYIQESSDSDPDNPESSSSNPDTPNPPDTSSPSNPADPSNPSNPDNPYVYPEIPEVPQTGISSRITQYLVLLTVSGVLLLMFLLEQRKEKK